MAADIRMDGDRPTNRRWVIFFLAAGTSFILYLHRFTWQFVRPELMKEYGFSNLQVDSLYTLFSVTYGLGQIPCGIICDFFGPHMFLGIIIAAWSLMMPCVGLGGGLYGVGVSRLLFGVTQAGCYPSLAKVTRVWFAEENRTSLQGLIASFFGRSGGAVSSMVIGIVLMGWLELTWRWSLIVLAATGVGFSFVFLKFCRNSPVQDPLVNQAERDLIRGDDTVDVAEPAVLSVRRAIRNRSMLVFVIQQYMNAGADYVYSAIMVSYFITARGVSDMAVVGLLTSAPLWGGAVGGVAGGFINDGLIRLTGRRRFARSSVGFLGKTIACGFLFLSINHPDPAWGAGLLFVTKFFSDWSQPTVWGACTDIGGRCSATVFSIINSAGSVGGTVTPIVGGLLLDRYTTTSIVDGVEQVVTNFNPVFLMVGLMYLASAVGWLFINTENSLDVDERTDQQEKRSPS
ncbi:MAG: MFS transporter [Fuerstiella sp.]|nr:MFS transporter [Fuerstiella sp.]